MDGLIFQRPGDVVHRRHLADPDIEAATDVIVRVHLAGLCGSDLHPYLGRERARAGVVPGHEAIGEVVATGRDVATLHAGDRVIVPFTTACGECAPCRRRVTARCERGQLFGYGDPDHLDVPALHGGQASLLRVPLADTTAVPTPTALSDEVALLLTDNLPTAWEAVQRSAVEPGAPLVVVGLGAVGICAVAAARALGADPVIGIDLVPGRRALAKQLGADAAFEPDDGTVDDLRRSGVGSAVDAAGTAAAQRLAFRLLQPGGTLSIIAVQTADAFAFTPVDAYDANLTVRAGRASVRSTLDDVLTALAAEVLTSDVAQVVTHAGVPLADGPDFYRRFAAREDGLVKAAFSP